MLSLGVQIKVVIITEKNTQPAHAVCGVFSSQIPKKKEERKYCLKRLSFNHFYSLENIKCVTIFARAVHGFEYGSMFEPFKVRLDKITCTPTTMVDHLNLSQPYALSFLLKDFLYSNPSCRPNYMTVMYNYR